MKNLIKHYFNNLFGYAVFSAGFGVIVGFFRWGMRLLHHRPQPPFTMGDMFETMVWTDIILFATVVVIIGINIMTSDSATLKVLDKIKEELF